MYYGEEIGMTGDKPDERLRTPMQWNSSSRGFTSGKPWEVLQPDTLTVNVAAEDGRPNSLLTLYRQLMQLRATNRALRDGRLEPIETGSESVLAYTRRADSTFVLVLVNVGNAAAAVPALARGEVRWRDLLGGTSGRSSLPPLAPRRAYVYELRLP